MGWVKPFSNLLYGVYARRLVRQLDPEAMPRHVALIIDGNRRWARQLGLDNVSHGHRAGAGKVAEFLQWCDELQINLVTLYLLSNDNLQNRGGKELDELTSIITELVEQIAARWNTNHVGSSSQLPDQLQTLLSRADSSEHDSGMTVNLAIGYGGRAEIIEAVRRIIQKYPPEELIDILSAEMISEHLYTGGMPDPDLIIRTSGEQRLSDFMPWQSTHSEFYFLEALGPNLRRVDFLRALRDFTRRKRRFGG